LQAQGTADQSDTKSQLQQLLIQFGLVPGDFQDKLGSLDDTIRALIAKNTESGISQYARMLEGKGDVQRETMNRLSSRGLGRSGAKGYRLRRNQLDFERLFSDAVASVLGNANSLQSGYAGREYGRQMSLSQMLSQLFSSYRPGGGGGGGGVYTPQVQSQQIPTFSTGWNAQPSGSLPGYTVGQPTATSPRYTNPLFGGQGGRPITD
jgi:hypothetical protein